MKEFSSKHGIKMYGFKSEWLFFRSENYPALLAVTTKVHQCCEQMKQVQEWSLALKVLCIYECFKH